MTPPTAPKTITPKRPTKREIDAAYDTLIGDEKPVLTVVPSHGGTAK